MRVLLLGAQGFIGRHIDRSLSAAGHEVVRAGSGRRPVPGLLQVDFARDTDVARWLPRLQGFGAVVNAVGVLRDTSARPMPTLPPTMATRFSLTHRWALCAQPYGVGRGGGTAVTPTWGSGAVTPPHITPHPLTRP